jgi:predicted nucleic acid-binding protein
MTVFALDANILSYLLRKDNRILSSLYTEQDKGNECVIPPLAYYEVKRGLLAVGSVVRLRLFEEMCRDFSIGKMDTATNTGINSRKTLRTLLTEQRLIDG